MFSRVYTALFYALCVFSIFAVATPWNTPTTTATSTTTVTVTQTAPASGSTSSCSTGPIQCCNSLESASSPAGSLLLGLLGVVVQGVDVVLGLDCSPITVIGVGSSSCSANVVCCQDNAVGDLVSVGCIPVTL